MTAAESSPPDLSIIPGGANGPESSPAEELDATLTASMDELNTDRPKDVEQARACIESMRLVSNEMHVLPTGQYELYGQVIDTEVAKAYSAIADKGIAHFVCSDDDRQETETVLSTSTLDDLPTKIRDDAEWFREPGQTDQELMATYKQVRANEIALSDAVEAALAAEKPAPTGPVTFEVKDDDKGLGSELNRIAQVAYTNIRTGLAPERDVRLAAYAALSEGMSDTELDLQKLAMGEQIDKEHDAAARAASEHAAAARQEAIDLVGGIDNLPQLLADEQAGEDMHALTLAAFSKTFAEKLSHMTEDATAELNEFLTADPTEREQLKLEILQNLAVKYRSEASSEIQKVIVQSQDSLAVAQAPTVTAPAAPADAKTGRRFFRGRNKQAKPIDYHTAIRSSADIGRLTGTEHEPEFYDQLLAEELADLGIEPTAANMAAYKPTSRAASNEQTSPKERRFSKALVSAGRAAVGGMVTVSKGTGRVVRTGYEKAKPWVIAELEAEMYGLQLVKAEVQGEWKLQKRGGHRAASIGRSALGSTLEAVKGYQLRSPVARRQSDAKVIREAQKMVRKSRKSRR